MAEVGICTIEAVSRGVDEVRAREDALRRGVRYEARHAGPHVTGGEAGGPASLWHATRMIESVAPAARPVPADQPMGSATMSWNRSKDRFTVLC